MPAIEEAIKYQKAQNKLRKAKECITDSLLSILDLGAENSFFKNSDYYLLRNLRAADTDNDSFKKYAENLDSNPYLDKRIKVALKKAIDYLN